MASPDEDLLRLLVSLAGDSRNEIVIVSGRDKNTLDEWFGGIDAALVAEHGVWIRERGRGWEMIEPMRDDWKEEIRPHLELCVDRTPGSFIEEKEFSLVWHYRKVEPGLGALRARELKAELVQLTANLDLGVLDGSKVVEIKNAGANKGRAAMHWMGKGEWDFMLAVGDDLTDEDIFAILPESAYSIRVNLIPSQARYNLESYEDVRKMLRTVAETSGSGKMVPSGD